jgi:hypothetical protein
MVFAECHPTRQHYGKGLCAVCYREKHREEIRENNRRWVRLNPESSKAHKKKWAKANPEALREKQKRLYRENPEKFRKLSREYRKNNPEVQTKRRHANIEKTREETRHRRSLRLQNGGWHTLCQWLQMKETFGSICLCCRRSEGELKSLGLLLVPDHIVPISRGGSDDISNIQPLCHGKGGCNNRKGNREAVDYRT